MSAPGVYVHPSSVGLIETDDIGEGTRVWANVQIRRGARVGRECTIGKDAFIDEAVEVGNRVKIQNGVSLYRGVVAEDGCFFGPHCTTTNDLDPASVTPSGRLKGPDDWTLGRTLFRSGARVGAHATVLCGAPLRTIGRWSLIGAHSLVVRDVPDFALVVGSPARVIRFVCPNGLAHVVVPRDGDPWCTTCGRPLANVLG